MSIERWVPKLKQEQCSEGLTLRMWTDKDGDYVLYVDHINEIDTLKNRIRELEHNLRENGIDFAVAEIEVKE